MPTSQPTTSNGRTVAGMYEAFGRGDVAFVLAQLDDELDWIESDAEGIPARGRFTPPQEVLEGVFAAVQNEIFFHTADGGSFDQDRAYVAAGYRMSPQFDIEMGYLNQYADAGGTSTSNHILQVATYIRL